MELNRLIFAVNTRKRHKLLDQYSASHCPAPDKRRACFARWQRMRKASLMHRVFAETADPKTLCACGALKNCSMERCYACKDMWALIVRRIPAQGLKGDAAKRYEPEPLRVYATPGPIHRPRKYLDWDEPTSGQENAIRALEDG